MIDESKSSKAQCVKKKHPFTQLAFVSAASNFQLLCLKRLEAWYSWCQYLVYIDTRWQIPLPSLLATNARLHQTTDLHHQHHHQTEKESHSPPDAPAQMTSSSNGAAGGHRKAKPKACPIRAGGN